MFLGQDLCSHHIGNCWVRDVSVYENVVGILVLGVISALWVGVWAGAFWLLAHWSGFWWIFEDYLMPKMVEWFG